MNILWKIKIVSLLSLAALVVVACNEDDMLLSYQHTAQVGVYSMRTGDDTVLVNVDVTGIGRTDTLYTAESTAELYLNLNLSSDTTGFRVCTQGTLVDELTFFYQKSLKPVSGSSGIAAEIHIDSVSYTSVFIDSVSIVEPDIIYNESETNVQIFIY